MKTMDSIYIVTGANAGIGRHTTQQLATQGKTVIMACRNMQRSKPVCEEIKTLTGNQNVFLYPLDLVSLQSINEFSNRIKNEGHTIAALINNAGIMTEDFEISDDGLEVDMQVNLVGTIALSLQLIDHIEQGGTIVNTISITRKVNALSDNFLEPEANNFIRLKRYGNSKLALFYATAKLHELCQSKGINVNAVDPGVVSTGMITMHKWFDPLADIFFRPFIKKPETAAKTFINAISKGLSGQIFSGKKNTPISMEVINSPETQKVWNAVVKYLEKKGF